MLHPMLQFATKEAILPDAVCCWRYYNSTSKEWEQSVSQVLGGCWVLAAGERTPHMKGHRI